MKHIAVTGGAGFIGSNLCKKLLEEGNKVFCIDNLYSGRMSNIEELKSNSNLHFYPVDIVNRNIVLDLDFWGNLDEIYNLACPASPPFYQNKPIDTLKTNFEGMINMLDLANKYEAKILQTSTSEVYGDPEVHPQPETYRGNVNPIGIRACYDEGKRVAETLCFDYLRTYNTDIKVVRIFNTYGPKMRADDGRVISNFICQALKNEPITVYGDGNQTRSFCFVDDLVNGLIKMMASNEHGPINLGNPGEFTMKELADLVINKIDTKSEIVYKPLPSDDPTKRKPVIDRAKELLNWEPTIALNEGLDKTIAYFIKELTND